MKGLAPLVVILLLAGCLRVGPGDDLHLVCEEKSRSPRKTYGLEHLAAVTRVEGELSDPVRLGFLEAARGHVVTMGGRPHAGFEATLVPAGDSWRFRGLGIVEGGPADEYSVFLQQDAEGRVVATAPPPSPGPVSPPRSIWGPAWDSTNATGVVPNATLEWAAWDPELPSCVSLGLSGERVVTNVVDGRVVHVG